MDSEGAESNVAVTESSVSEESSGTPTAAVAGAEANSVEDLTSLMCTSSIQNPPPTSSTSTVVQPSTPKKKDKKCNYCTLDTNKLWKQINILLKPVGDAPILKQKLWAVDPDKQVSGIIQFIRNYLRLESDHSLFVFVNQAFAPSPDQLLRNLYECFGSDGKLILHYSTTVAWG